MRKGIAAMLVTVGLLSTITSVASAAVRITKVQYDSPGTDYGSNSSLNAEWVRIKNTGSKKKSLDGWKLRDKAGHVYRFNDFRLGAGKWVKVHTGSGSDSKYHLYQDSALTSGTTTATPPS
jgi:lamin tail-like protein